MTSAAFISPDWAVNAEVPEPNGCAYYRLSLPAIELQKLGWDIAIGMPRSHPDRGFGVAHDDGAFFGFEISVFKLLMHFSGPSLFKKMQERGEKIVVDVDDFHFGLSEENIAFRQTNPNKNQDNNRMFYEMSVRQADLVTVSTAFLADFYEKRCRRVRLVRNALDVERYTMLNQDIEKPTIGWVGGTLWRSGDLETLSSWLPSFVEDNDLRVHHSGHIANDGKHFAARTGLRRVSTSPMSVVSKYPSLLKFFHIGLIPLAPSSFNESKSYLKGLEYAAAGIPFVAGPTEEYRLLASRGVGRIAESDDEWRDHLTELLDPGVRVEEAARQREIVESEFNITTRGEEWASALLS